MAKQTINWSSMAPIWGCYEMMGICPTSLEELLAHLRSPVLIVGGGGGLNVQFLRERGFQVDAIDSNPDMVALASTSRGIDITLNEGDRLPAESGSYATVVVATGVLNKATLYHATTRALLAEVRRVLQPGGSAILGYFPATEELDYAFQVLKLADRPSSNALFAGCDSLDAVAARFASSGMDPILLEHVFSTCGGFLEDHRRLMVSVEEALTRTGRPVTAFMSSELAFDYADLQRLDVKYLVALTEHVFGTGSSRHQQLPGDAHCLVVKSAPRMEV